MPTPVIAEETRFTAARVRPSQATSCVELSTGHHTIRLHHTGSRLHGATDPAHGESRLALDLSVNGAIATGTWNERTAPTGYYRGAVYHGTIQLVVSPHARGMNGRWLGFGKNFIVNSGDWYLEWLDA